MYRDEFARMKARQDIVTAFINKLEKAEWEKTQRLAEDYRSKINDAIFKYQKWVKEMRETVIKENPQAEYPNMKALRDFAQICIDESPNGYQRKLWMNEGDKMRTVTAILFDGKKAIIEANYPTTITIPVRSYP